MGFHVTWITVLGKAPDVVHKELGLTETGDREYLPESEITGALLPSGWYVVFFNDMLPAECEEPAITRLAQGASVMVFGVEETSMVSLTRGYANGALVWEVVHDSSEGMEHLLVTGTPPPAYIGVRDKLLAELAADSDGPDYVFDIPADLCKAMTGFRHDEDIQGIDGDPFAVLERV